MLLYEYFQESAITKAVEAEESYYLEICETSLKSRLSILAFLGEKCIGFVLNYIRRRQSYVPTKKFATKGYGNPKINKITVLMDEIKRNYSYFIPNCKKLFVLRILFVQPFFQGKGIATKLTKKSTEIARENGCDSIMATSSNVKSAHIFTKFGFQCVREIPYTSFQENGQTFLQSFGDGNDSVRLMILKLL
uniref:N-acetyltransferase domain-containing protein n=1 Tax=Panagrolaimus davidi TaxID=227884 RepID=A0A914PA76_9BILA